MLTLCQESSVVTVTSKDDLWLPLVTADDLLGLCHPFLCLHWFTNQKAIFRSIRAKIRNGKSDAADAVIVSDKAQRVYRRRAQVHVSLEILNLKMRCVQGSFLHLVTYLNFHVVYLAAM